MRKTPSSDRTVEHAVTALDGAELRYLVATLATHLEAVSRLLPSSASEVRTASAELVRVARARVEEAPVPW